MMLRILLQWGRFDKPTAPTRREHYGPEAREKFLGVLNVV